jgi:hypothetical protein
MRKFALLVAVLQAALVWQGSQTSAAETKMQAAVRNLKSDNPKDRALGLVTLGLMGKEAVGASRSVVSSLFDDSAEVRKMAGQALGKVNPAIAQPVLTLVRSDDYDSRLAALQTLAKQGKDASASIPALMSFFTQAKDDDKAKVVAALGTVGVDDQALAEKMASWAVNDPNPKVREAALKALPNIAGAKDQIGPLTKTLMNDKNVDSRINVINALATLGKGDKQVLATLEKLQSDPSPKIKEAAKKALKEMTAKK